jgi:hypothetical protein
MPEDSAYRRCQGPSVAEHAGVCHEATSYPAKATISTNMNMKLGR